MRLWKTILVVAATLLGSIVAANATARIHIDLGSQTMHVESSHGSFTWPVSTARAGYTTPRGSFAPTGLQRMHYSRKYDNAPMPYSIFFRGGYAIHGTSAVGSLGRPASHGCVRLSPAHAAQLFHMVQAEGGSISITGASPGSTRFASARHHGGSRFASLHRHGHGSRYASNTHHTHALGYAPVHHHRHPSVKSWQHDPYFGY